MKVYLEAFLNSGAKIKRATQNDLKKQILISANELSTALDWTNVRQSYQSTVCS